MKKHLFWLEDDALLGSILKKSLEGTEFELTHASDGTHALDLIKNMTPDIIMVDLLVPGEIDGFAFLEHISQDSRLKNIPKIVLSNLSSQKDIDRARALGVETFIVKASSSLDLIIGELRAQTAVTK